MFEEDLSGETMTVPASEPPPGLEVTQAERDDPIQSVVHYTLFLRQRSLRMVLQISIGTRVQ